MLKKNLYEQASLENDILYEALLLKIQHMLVCQYIQEAKMEEHIFKERKTFHTYVLLLYLTFNL